MKKLFWAVVSLAAVSCAKAPSFTGVKTDALDAQAWQQSEWISAADAPVVTGKASDVFFAADGASWFVSPVVNGKKVASARWMTTGLGVYQLFVNGKPVGEEILKPGFTHYAKTKRSFTYEGSAA